MSEKAQRKRLINLLKGIIDQLEHEHPEEEPERAVKQKTKSNINTLAVPQPH